MKGDFITEQILRVATFNNFNFTDNEFAQLSEIEDIYPEYHIMVNSNANPKIKGKYPAFICVNPHLNKFIEPKGDIELISAVRVKYVADAQLFVKKAFNDCVRWAYKHDVPILITYMRFRKLDTLKFYTKCSPGYYSWQKNYYRQMIRKTFDLDLFKYCDINEKGCPSCRNCSKLTYGYKDAKLCGINLSSSGYCTFNCPDCYVKPIIQWRGSILFDKVTQNSKQLGHAAYQLGYGKEQLSFEDWMKKDSKPLTEVGL